MAATRVCRVLTAALLALPLLGSGPATARAAGAAAAPAPAMAAGSTSAVGAGVELALGDVSPAVAGPGADVVVKGTITNTSAAPLVKPVVRVVADESSLQGTGLDRKEVAAWAAGTDPAQGREVGRTRVNASVPPQGSAAFTVTVKNAARLGAATYGALALSVESGGTSARTFAGYQRVKQYQPMSVAWAVPLTLDPDPDLFGSEGAARDAAWVRELGSGSRVARVLEATRDAPVTWAVDPTLTPGLLAKPLDIGKADTKEHELRAATEEQVKAGAATHKPWVLPDTDADVGALTGTGEGASLMQDLVGRAAPVAEALDGRADVAWPADAGYTTTGEGALRQLYRRPAIAAQVTAASALAPRLDGATRGASQRSSTGLALLTYDDSLSALLARTTSPGEGLRSRQQFVAESVALLNELPGTVGRSVLVTAPRTFNPDPEAAHAFFSTIATIPWLTPTTTEAQLAVARRAVPTAAAPVTRPSGTPTRVAPPVLTRSRVAALEGILRTVRGVALIRDDGDQFARTWSRAAEQLASTRWRSAPTAWSTLSGRVTQAARETTTALKVSASNINFLAESGRLQITVRNDLDVPVDHVKLTVDASNPRLRIDSTPSVLRIGPRSRATVNIAVTALAAGVVPLRTTLTTPDGTVVGQGADVQVRVTPTGDWVYWALGGIASAILLLGIWRSVRRRPEEQPVTTAPPARERTP